MAVLADIESVLTSIDTAVDNVAARLTDLAAKLAAALNAGGLSADEAAALEARLVALHDKLDALTGIPEIPPTA